MLEFLQKVPVIQPAAMSVADAARRGCNAAIGAEAKLEDISGPNENAIGPGEIIGRWKIDILVVRVERKAKGATVQEDRCDLLTKGNQTCRVSH